MAWVTPQYRRDQVNHASRVLVDPWLFNEQESEQAFEIISNWRSSHSFPLNTFKIGLLKKAMQVDDNGIVAQRLKRLSSIALKLHRFPEMKLSQMQDIAGCRAIVSSVAQVYKLVELYKTSDIKHFLVHQDEYIERPKESGYRGIHLIYRYYSDKKPTYNDLKVEVQIRSTLQHAWATAVETVGTFIRHALKSSQGDEKWLRFFALMSTFIAIRERCAIVPNTPSFRADLKDELREIARELDVGNRLGMYADALQVPEEVVAPNAKYFLLELDASAHHIKITGYRSTELEKASSDYLTVERQAISAPGIRDAVLVSVDSLAAVKRAYPNYFLDTHRFIRLVRDAVSLPRRKSHPDQQLLFE